MGSIYQPKLKSGELTAVWWISYYQNGRRIKESSHSADKRKAQDLLKEREGRVVRGEPVIARVDRITYDTCRADLEAHYRTTGKRELAEFLRRVTHLDRFFTGRRVAIITQADVDRYTTGRYSQKVKPATVRRELGSLVTLLRLAYQNAKLLRVPHLTKPADSAPRKGVFTPEQYAAVRALLAEDLQTALDIMHVFGWRRN